jgi:citrate synthase
MAMNARSASQAFRTLRVGSSGSDRAFVLILTCFQPIAVRPLAVPAYRNYSTSSEPDLKTTFQNAIPAKRELLKKVKALGGKTIGEVKVENTIGGMRYGFCLCCWNKG